MARICFRSIATVSLNVDARGNETAGRGGVRLYFLQMSHEEDILSTNFRISSF